MWFASLQQKIRRTFFAGLFVIVPIVITIAVLVWFFRLLDNLLAPVVKFLMLKFAGEAVAVPGLGFLIGILIVFAVGIVATNFLGKKIIKIGDYVVEQIPVVRNIYTGSKQIIEAISLHRENAFREAVLVEYPRKGIYSIGLIACDVRGSVQDSQEETLVNVFMPTTPNPTSGLLILVPKDQLIPLDLTMEEAVKYIVSLGMLSPESLKNLKRKEKPSDIAS